MTTFGHIIEGLFVLALIAAIVASAIDLGRSWPMAVAEGNDDQADERDEWADTDDAYQRWVDRQYGL